MSDWPRNGPAECQCPSVDVAELGTYILARLRYVLYVLVLVELMVAAATALTGERYKAFALVQLGQVRGVAPGVQGAMLERYKDELAAFAADPVQMQMLSAGDKSVLKETGLRLPVTFDVRPSGTVLLQTEDDTPETAQANMTRAVQRLLQLSSAAYEIAILERREHITLLKRSIGDLDAEIRALTRDVVSGQGQWSPLAQWSMAAGLSKLVELRGDLQGRLIVAEVEIAQNTIKPVVLTEPVVDTRPYKPRWLRNLGFGLLFGVPFGFFVVALLGVLLQVGRTRACSGAADSSSNP